MPSVQACLTPLLHIHRQEVIVVLSDDLVRHPEGTLRALCAKLGIPFTTDMLSWPPGPKPYGGALCVVQGRIKLPLLSGIMCAFIAHGRCRFLTGICVCAHVCAYECVFMLVHLQVLCALCAGVSGCLQTKLIVLLVYKLGKVCMYTLLLKRCT